MVMTAEDMAKKLQLNEIDRMIVGWSRRITVPFVDDIHALRQIGQILVALGHQIDFHSRRTDQLTMREIMSNIRDEVNHANRRIKSESEKGGLIVREGRRPASGSQEHAEETKRTGKQIIEKLN